MDYKNYIRVTCEIHDDEFPGDDRKIIWEKDSRELYGNDMLDCLRTIMCGLTFSEETFNNTLMNYVYENKLDKEKVDDEIIKTVI